MRENERAFVGRMTAGATHEFLNVLAIIGEASGLLQDILNLNRGELSSWDEKVKASLARIRHQTDRGTDLSECLNKFAHSLGDSEVRVDVNGILERLAVLMRHTARLEKVVLQTQRGDTSPVIVTDPLQLQIVLATFIEWCLDLASPGGTITLHAHELDQDVAIRCETAPRRVDVPGETSAQQRLAALEDLVCELGMHIVREGPHPFEAVELRIPRR